MTTFEGIERNSDDIPVAIFMVDGIKDVITEAELYDVMDFRKKYGFGTDEAHDEALAALLAFQD